VGYAIFFSLMFLSLREREQTDAYLLLLCQAVFQQAIAMLYLGVLAKYSNNFFPLVLQEFKGGQYSQTAHALALFARQVVEVFVSMFALIVPVYILLDWNGASFAEYWLNLAVWVLTLEFFVELIGLSAMNAATFIYGQVNVVTTVCNGIMISAYELPDGPRQLFYDPNPAHWQMVNALNLVFLKETRELVGSHPADITTAPGRAALARGSAYWCDDYKDDPTGVACNGPTFRDGLMGLQPRFNVINPDVSLAEGLGWMVCFGIAVKALATLRMFLRLRSQLVQLWGDGPSRPHLTPSAEKTERTALLAKPT